ncbi:MAG TPA: LysR family transcriptional regulator, partial [Terriglobales bacterium]|nr:LysR family transcriptional regulator [Terriglobales bacterium]
MRRHLPPLKTLEGFEAAARLGSFSAAAEALGLTQSAISHQIRQLEEALGQPLFRRLHRRIVLTDAGTDFQRSVNATLQSLRDGVNRLEPYRKPGSVIVSCDAALANAWLSPRIAHLKVLQPQID